MVTAMTWWLEPVRRLLSKKEETAVLEAIRRAEARTSGEIRVHVERRCAGNAMAAAERWFQRLGMDATRERNGILFYVAVDERAFAIVGGAGIHAKVGDPFWEALRDAMGDALQGRTGRGLDARDR
jgi:uncharacterized membrane protein